MNKIHDTIEKLRYQFERLGCVSNRTDICFEYIAGGWVKVWDPDYDPDALEPVEVNPNHLESLLSKLPDDAPTAEGEDGSVWEVILGLESDGYDATLSYINEMYEQ